MRRAAGVTLACLGLLLASPPLTPSAATVDRPFATSSPFNRAIPAGARTDPRQCRHGRPRHPHPAAARQPRRLRHPRPHRHPVDAAAPRHLLHGGGLGSLPAHPPGPAAPPRRRARARATTAPSSSSTRPPARSGSTGRPGRSGPAGPPRTARSTRCRARVGAGPAPGRGLPAGGGRPAGRDPVGRDPPRARPAERHRLRHGFRPPALKTDGDSRRADCLPEGARLQLDPALDLGSLPGLTPGERDSRREPCRPTVATSSTGVAPRSVSASSSTRTPPGAGRDRPIPRPDSAGTTTGCPTFRGRACACSTPGRASRYFLGSTGRSRVLFVHLVPDSENGFRQDRRTARGTPCGHDNWVEVRQGGLSA